MLCCERRAAALVAAVVAALATLVASQSPCRAQGAQTSRLDDATTRISADRPSLPSTTSGHPLTPVIDYARQEQDYLRQTIDDFTCRLVKRERIDGFLQEYQYIDMEVREELVSGGQMVRPMALFLHFRGPADVAGRKIVFIEGQNEGKMLVRNGGRRFEYVVAKIDPYGDSARRESLVPVTEVGFTRLLGLMIDVLERHRTADPTGENTQAVRIPGAKINQRPCTLIRVTHARPMDGLEFHVANVFVDDQLHVPVRVDYSGWPKRPEGEMPLIAEYTYTELHLNVSLPNAAFSEGRLRSRQN